MSSLFKFRCYGCEKLLKASPARIGKVVKCPGCGTELIVPSPFDEQTPPELSVEDSIQLEDLGLQIETDRLVDTPRTITPPPTIDPNQPDPIAFLAAATSFEEEGPPDPIDETVPVEGLLEIPDPAGSPLVSGTRTRRRSTLVDDPTIRRRDVILPRTAAVTWALFAILAIFFAFLAGLIIGHYRWK
ncbi:hypothetical protein P12x_003727 [Tundrisphaera lichenicola]|uniref:hypothetical protein n=1 Tax=Tundrisphaera lichenicola TaxID=2029860 RepID=UPI003EBA66C7